MTPWHPCWLIIPAHKELVNSDTFIKQNFEQANERIYGYSNQQKFESNVILNEAIQNISNTTDPFIISKDCAMYPHTL